MQTDLFAAPSEPRKRRARRATEPKPEQPECKPEPAITSDQRRELLRCVRLGLEIETACASAGVSADDVKADGELLAEVVQAYRKAGSRLREQGLAIALSTKNASFLEKILDRRDAELDELKVAAAPRAEKERDHAALVEKFNDLVVKRILHVMAQDPVATLTLCLTEALGSAAERNRPPTKLCAEAAAAALALLELLKAHPPLPYTPEWWAAEKAAGRNGSAKLPAPAAPAAATPAAPGEVEVIPPPRRRMRVLDPEQPLPANRAPVRPGYTAATRADAPWNVFSNS